MQQLPELRLRALNPARRGISSIFSNKFEWLARGAPVLVVNIQSFYSNQFFLRLSTPPLAREILPPIAPALPLPFRSDTAARLRRGRKEGTIQVSHEMDFRASGREEGGERKKGENFPRLSAGRGRSVRRIESGDSRWAVGGEFRQPRRTPR